MCEVHSKPFTAYITHLVAVDKKVVLEYEMKIGIVGLPNVGKSTLFNALTKAGAASANYPFCTIEPNVGIVTVPDKRVDFLASHYKSKSVIYATIEFVDIAGLVRGASSGEGLGNRFLAKIREVDAIVHVVRAFEKSDIIHVDGGVDPLRDIETINIELELADLEMKERRSSKKGANEQLPLLMDKPIIFCANVSEIDIADGGVNNPHLKKIQDFAGTKSVIPLSAQIEAELASIDDADMRAELMQSYGLKRSGLDRLISEAYKTLGLISFLTAGEQEVRAWTIKDGSRAPQAAGRIHTDFERGFIRAEVCSFDDFHKYGGLVKAREAGKVRSEGKDYIVKDGDVMLFRFNV